MRLIYGIFFLMMLCLKSQGQLKSSQITGIVIDSKDSTPIIGATIYLLNCSHSFTKSEFDGSFSLNMKDCKHSDSSKIIITSINYTTKEIKLLNFNDTNLIIALKIKVNQLKEVIIKSKNPISDVFAVTKIEKMDIYFNPFSNGDPLKAIVNLPSSTNTDESANPSLRGSKADRSVVIFNGTPIYQPVKNSQISTLGNFSLFNTEIINSQYVYSSNPPLIYGNSSAGLVDIESIKEIKNNDYQMSVGLANVGLFVTKKINTRSFIQAYSNYQFDNPFIQLNKKSLKELVNFGSTDGGINYHINFSKKLSLNLYSYIINENNLTQSNLFNFYDLLSSKKIRNFNILNLRLYTNKGLFTLNLNNNYSKSKIKFGNINANDINSTFFASLNYKQPKFLNGSIQTGIAFDRILNKYLDTLPIFYYAMQSTNPKYSADTSIAINIIQPYLYYKITLLQKLNAAIGVRLNYANNNDASKLNKQLSISYKPNKQNILLLSAGTYSNYSSPYFFNKSISLLTSKQIAFDYTYQTENILFKAATYYKTESGNNFSNPLIVFNKSNIWGIETYFEKSFKKYFKFTLSYTYLDSKVLEGDNKYNAENNLPYFIKSSIGFSKDNLFTAFLSYISRPGLFYTSVESASYNSTYNIYEPTFSTKFNTSQYNSYNNLSFTINKYFKLKKINLISFLSINNLFNTKNQLSASYNNNFSIKDFDYYSLRSIYFGIVLQKQ